MASGKHRVGWLTALALAAACTAFGCSGAQAGGQTGEETEGSCKLRLRELALDQTSPLGFSPQQLLDVAGSERTASVRWLTAADTPFGPESGAGSLRWQVTNVTGARFAEVDRAESTPECRDSVRVSASARLTTGSGAFDEPLKVELRAESPELVTFVQLLAASDLQGSFAFEPGALGDASFTRVQVDARLTRADFAGALAAHLEQSFGSGSDATSSLRFVPLACWGAAPIDHPACAP